MDVVSAVMDAAGIAAHILSDGFYFWRLFDLPEEALTQPRRCACFTLSATRTAWLIAPDPRDLGVNHAGALVRAQTMLIQRNGDHHNPRPSVQGESLRESPVLSEARCDARR